ncbi:MAG: hypothetical protein ACFCVF_03255 [Kineosporiaceae bacterium]
MRVVAPYLRGFGPTASSDAEIPRPGQLAALVSDLAGRTAFADGFAVAMWVAAGVLAVAALGCALLGPSRVRGPGQSLAASPAP